MGPALSLSLSWLLALVLVGGCARDGETPEQRITAVIEGVEQAVEEGSVKSAAALLDPGYRDEWHANRAAASRSLFGYLQRHRGVHLFTVIRSIALADDARTAQAVVYVAMTGVPVDSVETLIALRADLYRFDIELGLDADDAWRVRTARWQPADLKVL